MIRNKLLLSPQDNWIGRSCQKNYEISQELTRMNSGVGLLLIQKLTGPSLQVKDPLNDSPLSLRNPKDSTDLDPQSFYQSGYF